MSTTMMEGSQTAAEVVEAPAIEVASEEEEHRRAVFLRAAEIMERDGYERGCKAMATRGPVCLLGAVGRALGDVAIADEPVIEFEYDSNKVMREIVLSENSYDYCVTSAFVLDIEAETVFSEHEDGASSVYGFSDAAGKARVVQALRAMANGKTFAEVAS